MPATCLSEAEARQVEVVWPRRENGRLEASEEDYECRNGQKKTSWQTPNKMERRDLKRPGEHWSEDGASRVGGLGPSCRPHATTTPRNVKSSKSSMSRLAAMV